MSLHIFVAHTGERLDADPVTFTSLDALRLWLSKATSIPPQHQILLTTKGKHVKLQSLLTEGEIFLYDRELFTLSANQTSGPSISLSPIPDIFVPSDPPDTLSNQNNLRAWQNLFKARRDWALDLVERCRPMSQVAQKHFIEQSVIERGLRIATGNHEAHILGLEQKLTEAQTWLEEVSKEQDANLRTWEADLARLSSIPAKEEFRRFIMQGVTPRKETKKAFLTDTILDTFVDAEAVKKAASSSRKITSRLGSRVSDLGSRIERIGIDYDELLAAVHQSQSRSLSEDQEEPHRLLAEVDVVAKKIASDYEHVLSLQASPKSVAQVSKMALLHTRNYLPNIAEYGREMGDLLRRSVEQKNSTVAFAVGNMQTIAAIESAISSTGAEISTLDIPTDGVDAFELLGLVSRLPFVYGSLLIEAVRRREWVEKMKTDSSALAEEMAGYQEEEEKRRKKWLRSMSDMLRTDALEGKVLGIEINLQGEDRGWPQVSREDLQNHLKVLRSIGGLEDVVESFAQGLKDLDRPTRQQVKRAKEFKMGSVHDAGFGKGSLLLRGEDEMKVLREANAKLEEELKGQKSRVRKLEDLVHRQSQSSRLSSTSGFQPQPMQTPEPITPDQQTGLSSPQPRENLSRHPSLSSRRLSSNQATEDKALTRRILRLEAELLAEREAKAEAEKNFSVSKEAEEDMRRQLEEANSTKKDIMENMEAQQREFADERRVLEQEVNRYKLRTEEVEDELDRILGSRDNERTGTDDKLRSLVDELDQIRKEAAEEVQKAEERVKELEAALHRRVEAEAEHQVSLSTAYSHLSSEENVPGDYTQLIVQLEGLALRSVNHLKDLENAVTMAKFENDSLHTTIEIHKSEAALLSSSLATQEQETARLREELNAQEAKAASLSSELEEERQHLKALRAKFADGESGSEILRQRLAEEEAKVGTLSVQLAETKSHVNSLDVALFSLQKKHDALQRKSELDVSRLENRSSRAKDLTKKLYVQTDRLNRLLETLGFAVTHQDDTMIIQRASKAGASALMSDPSASLNRSISAPPVTTKKFSEDLSGLSLLNWMDKDDATEEAKGYTEYLSAVDRFNFDVFSEAITKRMRDIEHTARKWQKEARAYRDKSHRLQSEAHDKIAFKSFKEGDLALFLPTRNQATRPWAAFNVGAPHYFLREQDSHRLHSKEWLVARISKVEERVVDLSKAMSTAGAADGRSIGETSDGGLSYEDDNPFELSDGLRWYLLDAAEEKAGAPTTPGLGKSTVASARVSARGDFGLDKKPTSNDVSKTLNKSLESRRSSSNSKRSVPKASSSEALGAEAAEGPKGVSHLRSGSQASSLLPNLNADEVREGDEEGRENTSPPKSAAASPSKSLKSASVSPTKAPPRPKTGIWDSLWQLDVSLESGKGKK